MSQLPPPEQGVGPGDFAPIGTPVGPGTPLPQKPRANGWAITSLITGLLGCVPYAMGLIAVITGIVGLKKAWGPGWIQIRAAANPNAVVNAAMAGNFVRAPGGSHRPMLQSYSYL